MVDKPEKITEHVVMTVVRGPMSYEAGGFAARIKEINQIVQELSGEYKVSVVGCKTSGYTAYVTSGAISGNVATVRVLSLTSGGGVSGLISEVTTETNLSGVEIVIMATGY